MAAPKKAPVPAERLRTYPMTLKESNDVRHVGWKLVPTAEQIDLFRRLAMETKHTGEPFCGDIVAQPFAVVIRRTNVAIQAKSKEQIKKEQSQDMYQWFNKRSRTLEVANVRSIYVRGKVLAIHTFISAKPYVIVMSHDDDRVFAIESDATDGKYDKPIDISELKIKLKAIAYHAAA